MAALNAGDLERAERLAAVALKLDSNDDQPGYLGRVIARERLLRQASAVGP